MKLLHFIDGKAGVADNEVFSYLPSLLHALSRNLESSIIISQKHSNIFNGLDLNVNTYKSSCFCIVKNRLRFKRILNDFRPEMVHIHGCSCSMSAIFMQMCVKRNIPVVISLGKELEPWNRYPYLTGMIPRLVRYQYQMLKSACSIHCLTAQEQDDFLDLRWLPLKKTGRPWNTGISVIPNYKLSPNGDAEHMALEMESFYAKVADSNPFMMMSHNDRRCEDILLSSGIDSDRPEFSLSETDKVALSLLNDESLRYILIHSHDEGISNQVINGALKLNIHIPNIQINSLERFSCHYDPSVIADVDIQKNPVHIETDNNFVTEAEMKPLISIINFWHKFNKSRISRKDFTELCNILRFTDYDEVVLLQSLRKMGYFKCAARILAVLGERYMLTEGYMFMPPLEDNSTKRMRKRLFKMGIQ